MATTTTNIPTKAYVVEEKGGPFVLKDVILDTVGPDELLVEIKYAGVCHTDLVVQSGGMPIGAYPAVLGHEGAGIIRAVGAGVKNKSLRPGQQVFLSFRTCQECDACVGAAGNCGACAHMTEYNFVRGRLDGSRPSPIRYADGRPIHGQFFGQSAFSRMAVVSERSVVSLGEGGLEEREMGVLAPLGCGYLTGAATVLNVLKPAKGASLAVLGMGAVGNAALLAARAIGMTEVMAVDIVEGKLQLARELGATYTVNTAQGPGLVESIRGIFPQGVDYIVDTTAVQSVMQASLGALAHGGTLALVGAMPPETKLELNALDVLTGCKKIMGVIEGYSNPQQFIPTIVQWYKEGKFAIDKVVKVYPAAKLDEALADLKAGKVIKPVLSWDEL
ncbi:chaperonin 10-like protein [Aspergillus egyptiacus]|nr:chaperonin 10-like protein [Aspergillus egyptiacus]